LIADYPEYLMGFWVARTRYADKAVRNESVHGCGIIGFRILDDDICSPEDMLAIFEARTQFSENTAKPRLQDAVEGSAKDQVRKAESLNAIKQRLHRRQLYQDAEKVERFQGLKNSNVCGEIVQIRHLSQHVLSQDWRTQIFFWKRMHLQPFPKTPANNSLQRTVTRAGFRIRSNRHKCLPLSSSVTRIGGRQSPWIDT
jgi:hypothetical protein